MYMTFETLSLIFQLYSLGELCGLMPEDDIQPTSEQLKMIIDFTSGMGIADDIYSGMRIADKCLIFIFHDFPLLILQYYHRNCDSKNLHLCLYNKCLF
jgi:hypothetical protein